MNDEGNEALREDISRRANDVHELQQRMKLLEQKYRCSTEILFLRFAGQTLRTAGVACTAWHQQRYNPDLIFSD